MEDGRILENRVDITIKLKMYIIFWGVLKGVTGRKG